MRAAFIVLGVVFNAALAFAQPAARAQTAPLPSGPTAGYDTAIWLHPGDRAASLVFGSDQLSAAGLRAYGLDGGERAFYQLGPVRGVDLRYRVQLTTGALDVLLVATASGEVKALSISEDGGLGVVGSVPLGLVPLALAAYVDPATGQLNALVAESGGTVRRVELIESSASAGTLTGTAVATVAFDGGAVCDGLAVDERSGRFYYSTRTGLLGEGTLSPLEATTVIDGPGAHLAAPLGGVAVQARADGGTLLLVSLQSRDEVAIYQRDSAWGWLSSMTLRAPSGSPAVGATIGLELVAAAVPDYDGGLLVAHDGRPVTGPNFKLFAWEDVASASNPPIPVSPVEVGPWVAPGGGTGGGAGGGAGGGSGGSGGGSGGGRAGGSGTGGKPINPIISNDPEPSCGCHAVGLAPLALAVALAALRRRRSSR